MTPLYFLESVPSMLLFAVIFVVPVLNAPEIALSFLKAFESLRRNFDGHEGHLKDTNPTLGTHDYMHVK